MTERPLFDTAQELAERPVEPDAGVSREFTAEEQRLIAEAIIAGAVRRCPGYSGSAEDPGDASLPDDLPPEAPTPGVSRTHRRSALRQSMTKAARSKDLDPI